jgi:hypothetical protein
MRGRLCAIQKDRSKSKLSMPKGRGESTEGQTAKIAALRTIIGAVEQMGKCGDVHTKRSYLRTNIDVM